MKPPLFTRRHAQTNREASGLPIITPMEAAPAALVAAAMIALHFFWQAGL